ENAPAPSTLFAPNPATTAIQVRVSVNKVRIPPTPSHAVGPAEVRKPISKATPTTIATATRLATTEVSTWAQSALARASGIARNRSKMPLLTSVNSRVAV